MHEILVKFTGFDRQKQIIYNFSEDVFAFHTCCPIKKMSTIICQVKNQEVELI